MYGLSDHLKAMPFTAFRALRQGSSRYSARMGGAGSIERAFGTGVERLTLPLPTGPRHVHCYLIDGDEGRLLVDAGLGLPGDEHAWDGLEVDSIVLTHMHPDHVGGAQRACPRGAPPSAVPPPWSASRACSWRATASTAGRCSGCRATRTGTSPSPATACSSAATSCSPASRRRSASTRRAVPTRSPTTSARSSGSPRSTSTSPTRGTASRCAGR